MPVGKAFESSTFPFALTTISDDHTTMRLAVGSVGCVGCVLALAVPGICEAVDGEHKAAGWIHSSFDNLAGWPRVLGQEKLGKIPAEALVHKYIVTKILETVVTESYPRITEAPILKRKAGSNKWNLVHDAIQGQKRDATICPSNYQLCPQSLNGGCCPTDRVCGSQSCLPATTGPASACGTVGYSACAFDEGGEYPIDLLWTKLTRSGGCCPTNYICGLNGCTPSAGVPVTSTCNAGSYLCPAAYNYGCCQSGLACGPSNCYSTEVVTFTLIDTITTTSSGHVKTITSNIVSEITPSVPSVPTTGVTSTAETTVAKVTTIPAAIAKVAATSPNGGGLTKPQLDGIIAGAVILLVIIVVATYLILARLNRVKKAVDASSRQYRSYATWSQSGRSQKMSPKGRGVEVTQVDPMMTASDVSKPKHARHPSEPTPIHMAHEMDASPPLQSSPFSPSPISPQYHKYTGGYAPVATSEPPSPPLRDQYTFSGSPTIPSDITTPLPDLRDQNLRFGRLPAIPPPGSVTRPAQHERQWSGDSNTSNFSQASSNFSESDPGLDKSNAGSSSERSFYGFRWMQGRKK